MDTIRAMIKDAETMRDRYQSMLETIENNTDDPDAEVSREEMIVRLRSAIQPLDEFLALYRPKN